MKENNVHVLLIKPMEHPKAVIIPNSIKSFSRLLGFDKYYACGTDVIILDKYIGILRNPDAALIDLPGNRKINDEIIAGPFCIIAFDEHGFITSLSDEEVQRYSKHFWNIETFTDREVMLGYWNKFEEKINLLELECNAIL